MDMSKREVDKYRVLVLSLVEIALGIDVSVIRTAESDTEINNLVRVDENRKPKVIWLRNREDAIYQFWLLRDKGVLADKSWIIFTGIEDSPLWRDLSEYEGGKFGSMYVLHYDSSTNVGVKPSQRGIYMRDGGGYATTK
jgi:hypothetical protein